ncbi:hypothetical protein GUITHDRAFT_149581 [Guillardia theta CCMP2712]|uniref:Uncharacterized protein n=1 Tax=Guillardia theta (strain CCMP2712) TaxID=905079 RepID=L1I3Z5_GUITC|nr:hypothetical protein GUITHDRAFT_149581 [Guillardia theta CCMP2712]EKX30978.1 hypothetical protein GUITHDRAFT_149581 [Guillardia theta CCMP2712]|eukprot:XP_005817958.1 hypothetical protein GUITHDRAFT_149581 [Guillardia theta CCMP2712]
MTGAKDDPSLLQAVSSYPRWNDVADQTDSSGSSSPTFCASDASVATTPRQYEATSSISTSPSYNARVASPLAERECETRTPAGQVWPSPTKREVAKNSEVPVRIATTVQENGKPLKLELSLTPEMLKRMTEGSGNICFVVKGVNGKAQLSIDERDSVHDCAEDEQADDCMDEMPGIDEEDFTSENSKDFAIEQAASDEDLIAMLAGCAKAGSEQSESFAQVVQEQSHEGSASGSHGDATEAGDAELMAALANSAVWSLPFEQEDAQVTYNSSHVYMEDEMMELNGFCGMHGIGIDDYLSVHA